MFSWQSWSPKLLTTEIFTAFENNNKLDINKKIPDNYNNCFSYKYIFRGFCHLLSITTCFKLGLQNTYNWFDNCNVGSFKSAEWQGFVVVFPRDGTSCRTSRDKKKILSRCPVVPLSRDKGKSKCPRTNFSVPAHPGTKWFKNFQEKRPDYPF